MGYPKIVKDAKGVMCVIFYAYGVRSLSCDVHHYRTTPSRLAPSSTTGTLLNFLIYTRTLKQDDLAAAFSAASLTELEQNYSSGLVDENNTSLFAEIPKYFLFCLSILSTDKTSKKIDRYLVNREAAI